MNGFHAVARCRLVVGRITKIWLFRERKCRPLPKQAAETLHQSVTKRRWSSYLIETSVERSGCVSKRRAIAFAFRNSGVKQSVLLFPLRPSRTQNSGAAAPWPLNHAFLRPIFIPCGLGSHVRGKSSPWWRRRSCCSQRSLLWQCRPRRCSTRCSPP